MHSVSSCWPINCITLVYLFANREPKYNYLEIRIWNFKQSVIFQKRLHTHKSLLLVLDAKIYFFLKVWILDLLKPIMKYEKGKTRFLYFEITTAFKGLREKQNSCKFDRKCRAKTRFIFW